MARVCVLTGKKVGVGHKVSHSNHKTKRKFVPNLIKTTLYSALLKRNIRLRIAARTLRTIDYKGDFDSFILQTKNGKLTNIAKKIKKKLLLLREKENVSQ